MRVSANAIGSYPWYLKPFFWRQKRKYGQVLLPGLIWGKVPSLFASVALLYGALDRKKSPINPVLRSLVTVRVSELNGCEFCVDINSVTLAKRLGSWDKVQQLAQWRESELFSREERAALAYAEAMTASGCQVDDGIFDDVQQCFREPAIIELTALIAFQNMSSKFNSALTLPAQGFCSLQNSKQ